MQTTAADNLMIGWTTTSDLQPAELLAKGLIGKNLAVCVHLEEPVTAFYKFEDKLEETKEYKLAIKFLQSKERDLLNWLIKNHPYDTPQWIALNIDSVSQPYLDWAQSNV